jgi:hypothetical protein
MDCVICHRSDEPTALFLRGGHEWLIAALPQLAGVSLGEAEDLFLDHMESQGYDREEIARRDEDEVGLCMKCADAGGLGRRQAEWLLIPSGRQPDLRRARSRTPNLNLPAV